MTNTVQGIIDADVIFITGSNTTEAHPVIGAKIRQAKAKGAKIIVADPRRIDLAQDAEIYMQIRPGTNIALYNAMLHVIIEEGLQDEAFIRTRTENFGIAKENVKEYTPEKAAKICGINADDVKAAARMYARADKAGIFYSMGVTQFATGTKGVMSIANLALAAGHVGKDSAGVNPLRGQNNVQGACDMGCLPNVYPGYQPVTASGMNEKFKKAWDVDYLSDKAGLTLTAMFDHFGESVKLLYMMGENPLLADADVNHCKEQLEKQDFFIAQDIFLNETSQFADVILPAMSYAEKDGTFANTERRIQRVRKAVKAPGLAKTDLEIICEISKRMGLENKFATPEETMAEIASVTPSYGGITYKRLEDINGLHWPCPAEGHPGTPVLHKEKFTRPNGLASFAETPYTPPDELPDENYPFILTTGRGLYQFHTRTMSGKVEGLNKKAGRSEIEINPADAERLGVAHGDKVKASSRRGDITTYANVTDKVAKGVVFMPFHFADGPANALTNPVRDATSSIPELKVCACQVEKV
jgi:formate dehydrogenase major subunit